MTAVLGELSAPQENIARRWDNTADQVAHTAVAVWERRLSLANTPDELTTNSTKGSAVP